MCFKTICGNYTIPNDFVIETQTKFKYLIEEYDDEKDFKDKFGLDTDEPILWRKLIKFSTTEDFVRILYYKLLFNELVLENRDNILSVIDKYGWFYIAHYQLDEFGFNLLDRVYTMIYPDKLFDMIICITKLEGLISYFGMEWN